jgi:hypothetical protein
MYYPHYAFVWWILCWFILFSVLELPSVKVLCQTSTDEWNERKHYLPLKADAACAGSVYLQSLSSPLQEVRTKIREE